MPQETSERITAGPLGKLVGKIKRAAGAVTDDELLAREGRLQEAQSDAAREARERELAADAKQKRADLEGQKLETDAERARLGIDVEEATRRQQADQEREKAAEAERLARTIEQKETRS